MFISRNLPSSLPRRYHVCITECVCVKSQNKHLLVIWWAKHNALKNYHTKHASTIIMTLSITHDIINPFVFQYDTTRQYNTCTTFRSTMYFKMIKE